jgi:hypothetical protein
MYTPRPCQRPRAAWLPLTLFLPLLALLALVGGCSDAASPAKDGGNRLDPVSGTFALKDVSVPGPDGRLVLLRLEGTGLVADAEAGTVALTVQVRNLSGEAVNPPLIVWVGDLQPNDVAPLNADLTLPGDAANDTTRYGFDYTALLEGGPLAAGEATPGRTWLFSDASLAPFSFSARIETGVFEGQARIGGRLFFDLDRDGLADSNEPPYLAGGVQVTGPDGTVAWASPGRDGRWETAVAEAGLYEVLFQSLEMGPLPVPTTTPNPRSVVLTTGADGVLQDFLEAHVGVARDWTPPTDVIGFTDRRPIDLHRAWWMFLGAEVEGPRLRMQVGFSGCQPEHEFSLWMSGGFLESMPPRAHLTLVHETQEACDAAFTASPEFDLRPLYAMYLDQYGPGPLVLVVHGPDGFTHEIAGALAIGAARLARGACRGLA